MSTLKLVRRKTHPNVVMLSEGQVTKDNSGHVDCLIINCLLQGASGRLQQYNSETQR